MDPLPGGKDGMLRVMFCERTEESTSGKSVARMSQPRELRARLGIWRNYLIEERPNMGRRGGEDELFREINPIAKRGGGAYAERPIPLPSSMALGRAFAADWVGFRP